MDRYILNSGKIVEFNLAPIAVAKNLYKAVVLAARGHLDITKADEQTIMQLLLDNIDALLSIMGDDAVIQAVEDCAKHILYDKQKFCDDLFEIEKNRPDYMPVMTLVCIENLRYFFAKAHIIFDAVLSEIVK